MKKDFILGLTRDKPRGYKKGILTKEKRTMEIAKHLQIKLANLTMLSIAQENKTKMNRIVRLAKDRTVQLKERASSKA